jgi:radical SAM-linked protein
MKEAQAKPPKSAACASSHSRLCPHYGGERFPMVPDPPQDTLRLPAAREAEPVRDKVRIRFRKGGDLRLVSHHDLMHCVERMFRRAALPFHSTEGFNPKPRMAFALSLALGIIGCEEVLELELDAWLPPEELHERLARQAPAGLEILSVSRIDRKTRAQVRRVCYRIAVPAARAADLPERCADLMANSMCWIDRTRPQPRRLDVRPYLRNLHVMPAPARGDSKTHSETDAPFLEMDLWVTPNGTVRPEEILGLLGLQDLLEAGAVLERTKLALHDEDQTPDSGPLGPPAARNVRSAGVKSTPRPAPLLPGPLSFDS